MRVRVGVMQELQLDGPQYMAGEDVTVTPPRDRDRERGMGMDREGGGLREREREGLRERYRDWGVGEMVWSSLGF